MDSIEFSGNAAIIISGKTQTILSKSAIHFEFHSYERLGRVYTVLKVVHSITGNILLNVSDDPSSEYNANDFGGGLGYDMPQIISYITNTFYAT